MGSPWLAIIAHHDESSLRLHLKVNLRIWGTVLGSAITLLTSPVTWATSTTTTTHQIHLDSINQFYQSLEYESALAQIHLARQDPLSQEEEVLLFLYEGILLVELGEQERGSAAFTSALMLQPDARLPVQVAPKIEEIFGFAQQQIEAAVSPQQQESPEPPPIEAPTVVSIIAYQEEEPRRYSLIPAIVGGCLTVAGGVSLTISHAKLNHLRGHDIQRATPADIQRSLSRGRAWQTVGISLLGVGMVGLATAAGLYAVESPSTPGVLDVASDGSSALVMVRWP